MSQLDELAYAVTPMMVVCPVCHASYEEGTDHPTHTTAETNAAHARTKEKRETAVWLARNGASTPRGWEGVPSGLTVDAIARTLGTPTVIMGDRNVVSVDRLSKDGERRIAALLMSTAETSRAVDTLGQRVEEARKRVEMMTAHPVGYTTPTSTPMVIEGPSFENVLTIVAGLLVLVALVTLPILISNIHPAPTGISSSETFGIWQSVGGGW